MCSLNKQQDFLHFVYLHYSRDQLFQLTHLPHCIENTGCSQIDGRINDWILS